MTAPAAPAPPAKIAHPADPHPATPTGTLSKNRGIEALVAAELPPGESVRHGPEGAAWLHHPPRDLFGIALSGGGIRSATYNLGLLQGLHELQLLRAFDYLSTVSGGGYAGAFWTAWRGRRPGREGRFPCDVPAGAAEPPEIRHLREFSNFLSPRLGVFSYDTGRMLIAALGAMVPSLLAALSLIAVGVLAWVGINWLIFSPTLTLTTSTATLLGITLAALVLFEVGWRKRGEPADGAAYPVASLLAVALTAAIWVMLPSVRESGAQHLHDQILPGIHGHRLTDAWLYTFAPAAAWGLTLMLLVFVRWFFSLAARWPRWQRIRRATDRVRSRLLLLTAGWTVLTVLWFAGLLVEYHLLGRRPELYGPGVGGLSALLVTAFARAQKLISTERAESAAASLVTRLKPLLPQMLAYAVVALMVMGTTAVIVAAERAGGVVPFDVIELTAGVLVVTLLVLLLMEPNEVGLHAFYRSRLVRAYPGASNDRRAAWPAGGWPGRANPNVSAAGAGAFMHLADDPRVPNRETEVVDGDDPRLDELRDGALRPFPLVCCTANDLASRDDMANLSRGGTSAVLSPLGCSVGNAWAPWREYRMPPTLGGAITASGAAFNTLMGSFSRQLGPAVTFVAAALNLRLGMWVSHPERPARRRARVPGWLFYREMFGAAQSSGPGAVHLSDGGHFENTAVYELIRRHCRVILASDCGADGESAFDDLGNMVRRVREDFGVDVRIDTRPLRPGPDGFSRQHMVAGDIHYPDGDTGVLLLFKPVLTGTEPADVLQYRARNGAFPHESTGDQFYDEAQWESYRRLGEYGVTTALRVVTDGLQLLRSGRSDQELRPVWGDAFARARREWFPEPEGYGERLSRFTDRVAELDGLLREGGCRLLMEQVYKELPEMERQNRVLLNAPVMGLESELRADGADRVVPVSPAPPAPPEAAPSAEELASSLYLIRRALLLMEELFHGEDLARNYSHPRYLGVMNWCARWAYAPLFRLWWPLLKTMYPQPFTRFMERHFSLTGVEHPVGVGERLDTAVRAGGDGFAEECWRRQGMPPAAPGETVLSYHLRMSYAGQRGYELQAARLGATLNDGTLVWDAERFYVPPGLWGVGIGTDFLRALRWGAAAGVQNLVARVAFDPAAGSAGRKRAADEIHLYRAAGFREVDLVGGCLLADGASVPLDEAWVRRGNPETQWLFARAAGALAAAGADQKLPPG